MAGGAGKAAPLESTAATTTYHTMTVGGVGVFYREAGPKDAPALVLLHGFPSSSREFEAALLYDYRTNVAAYPAWQAWLRAHQPPTLVVWGRNDPSFIAAGAEAFRRDLPGAEIHLLDAGHFALDEKNDEIAGLILDFLPKHAKR